MNYPTVIPSSMTSLPAQMSDQPLLHVLSHPTQTPQEILDLAVQGRQGQELARAEIELRKVTKALSTLAGGTFNDPVILAALSLPSQADAVLWVAYMLFDQAQPAHTPGYSIHKRQRDCRTLLDALSQIKIGQWYEAMVTPSHYGLGCQGLQFPAMHPQPNGLYRQHLLPRWKSTYYPVDSYFTYLFEERKRELLQILADLGATNITLQPSEQTDLANRSLTAQVWEFPGKSWSSTRVFNPSRYAWLTYDQQLDSLVNNRLSHGLNKAQFEINLDVDQILSNRFSEIKTFLNQMESLDVAAMTTLLQQSLRPYRVNVEFAV